MIKQEEALVDEELFMILQRLIRGRAAGEEESAQVLVGLQQDILENTDYGQEILYRPGATSCHQDPGRG